MLSGRNHSPGAAGYLMLQEHQAVALVSAQSMHTEHVHASRRGRTPSGIMACESQTQSWVTD